MAPLFDGEPQNFIAKLGVPGKLALLYLAGGALMVLGWWLGRRMESVRNYARVLLAGGAAAIYYTTYAAHFVPRLRVIENPVVGGAALLLLAGGLAWFATRRKLEGVAFTAILLSYYTSAINPAANFTLFSNAVLTVAAVVLLGGHRWLRVSWLGLVGSYASFAYWRLHIAAGGDFWFTHGFLIAYWIIFSAAVFLQRGGVFPKFQREAFLTVNNAAFFVLFGPAFHDVAPEQFWLFAIAFAGVLLVLSLLAGRLRPDEPGFDGAYLAQGLIVLAVGLVAKFAGYQLAVILAVEGSALLSLSRFRQAFLLRAASGLASSAAAVLAIEAIVGNNAGAWAAALLVVVLLIGNAVLLKILRGEWREMRWTWGAVGYAWAGLLVLVFVLGDHWKDDALIHVLPAAALAGMLTLRFHRLPEISLGLQGYLTLAALLLLPRSIGHNLGWSNAFPVLVASLVAMHWWQWGRFFSVRVSTFLEGWNAVTACVALLWWIWPDDSATAMLTLSLAGLGILAYACVTRSWLLAACSLGCTLPGAGLCLLAIVADDASWQLTAGTIAVVAVQAAARRVMPDGLRTSLKPALIAFRFLVLVLAIAWGIRYLPVSSRFLVFVVAGLLIFIPSALRRNREYLVHAALLIGAGVFVYLRELAGGSPGSGADFLAFVLLVAFQQAGKRLLAGTTWFPTLVQNAVAVAAVGGLWFQATRWAWTGGVAETVVWAVLAFAALGAGFLLRERALRLMGLLILAVAVGHVFLIDVWKMGQVAGILGIIVLALVLLSLGFIYNRFAEQIKKWL